ncbi:hypothetical protein SUDANB58_00083 [Streptomyces sp. enrichment culture]
MKIIEVWRRRPARWLPDVVSGRVGMPGRAFSLSTGRSAVFRSLQGSAQWRGAGRPGCLPLPAGGLVGVERLDPDEPQSPGAAQQPWSPGPPGVAGRQRQHRRIRTTEPAGSLHAERGGRLVERVPRAVERGAMARSRTTAIAAPAGPSTSRTAPPPERSGSVRVLASASGPGTWPRGEAVSARSLRTGAHEARLDAFRRLRRYHTRRPHSRLGHRSPIAQGTARGTASTTLAPAA